ATTMYHAPAATKIDTLSLHDALPIYRIGKQCHQPGLKHKKGQKTEMLIISHGPAHIGIAGIFCSFTGITAQQMPGQAYEPDSAEHAQKYPDQHRCSFHDPSRDDDIECNTETPGHIHQSGTLVIGH